jgi:DDE superfamily endonuclease/Helix-turn-helix of DDE superfamily endonuclease
VKKKVFYDMVKVVKEDILINKKSGRKNKLSIEEQILLTLSYLREYRTYFHLGIEFGLNESNVYRTIIKIESILIKSELFKLPGQKTLTDKATELSSMEVIVDVTETEIERSQKKQKKYYSGKKKKHTFKSEIFADKNTKQIICTGYGMGAEHDFKIFKKRQIKIRENILILADKGYLGINKIHANSKIPHKKKKGEKLSKEQKNENKELNKQRVIIEHINR